MVNEFLESISKELVFDDFEKVYRSISSLKDKLNSHFDNRIVDTIIFGSFMKSTNLPISIDLKSDVDLMVVFNNDENVNPQTYLDRLRKFANKYYRDSIVSQSFPTIVLQLKHIRIELVPAKKKWFPYTHYKIPSPENGYKSWIETLPNEQLNKLSDKNDRNKELILPTIRLVKYWNLVENKIYDPFFLERLIIEKRYYSLSTLKEYFFTVMASLSTKNLKESDKVKVNECKCFAENILFLEKHLFNDYALMEMSKLLPSTDEWKMKICADKSISEK